MSRSKMKKIELSAVLLANYRIEPTALEVIDRYRKPAMRNPPPPNNSAKRRKAFKG